MGNSKGNAGERGAKELLESLGWLVADKETSGLAGDDLFARSPEGVWYSIEVKHVQSLQPAHEKQARRQAAEREAAILEARRAPRQSIVKSLDIAYDKRHWLLMWRPSGFRVGSQWVVLRGNGRNNRIEVWDCEASQD